MVGHRVRKSGAGLVRIVLCRPEENSRQTLTVKAVLRCIPVERRCWQSVGIVWLGPSRRSSAGCPSGSLPNVRKEKRIDLRSHCVPEAAAVLPCGYCHTSISEMFPPREQIRHGIYVTMTAIREEKSQPVYAFSRYNSIRRLTALHARLSSVPNSDMFAESLRARSEGLPTIRCKSGKTLTSVPMFPRGCSASARYGPEDPASSVSAEPTPRHGSQCSPSIHTRPHAAR